MARGHQKDTITTTKGSILIYEKLTIVKMRVLNLYAGIGGNRELWPKECDVVAIENNPEIAKIYQEFFPDDKVIVADAHQYLLNKYKNKFDFIWSSPPCPTHSDIRRMGVDIGRIKPIYPDMELYQEVIFLNQFCKNKWVIENVIAYYNPLIKPQEVNRHWFWSNFHISKIKLPFGNIKHQETQPKYGFNLNNIQIDNKRTLLRNLVNPKLGLHIFNCAFKEKQRVLE